MTSTAACLSQESDVSIAGRFLTPLFANTDTAVGLKAAQLAWQQYSFIGTPRVRFFMYKFRKLGLIDYNGGLDGLEVHSSLLSIVLHD